MTHSQKTLKSKTSFEDTDLLIKSGVTKIDKVDDELESVAGIFWTFGSKNRLDIINELLCNDKLRMVDIAKKLSLPVQAVQRPLEDLLEKGMIEKDSRGYFTPTFFCKSTCIHMPYFNFMSENKKYFQEHDFGDIPKEFIQRMSVLDKSVYLDCHPRILEKWMEMYENTDEYIYNTFHHAEYVKDIMDPLFERLEKGIKTRTIFSKDTLENRTNRQREIAKKFSKFKTCGKIEQKFKDQIKISVIVTDKESLIMFPRIGGGVDTCEAFYSKEKDFHKWCFDYFNYCWEAATPFPDGLHHEIKKTNLISF